MDFILASASPRRKELFSRITDDFKIIPSSADETIPENISAFECAEYLAVKKASQIAEDNKNAVVTGCDTVVIADNKILGKPSSEKNAYEMLEMLSGKVHYVVTGVCICYKDRKISFSSVTEVEFYPLSDDDINGYIKTGEPFDKAGAYGIQGLGSLFVKKINGDFYNVVGLPVAELSRKIKEIVK